MFQNSSLNGKSRNHVSKLHLGARWRIPLLSPGLGELVSDLKPRNIVGRHFYFHWRLMSEQMYNVPLRKRFAWTYVKIMDSWRGRCSIKWIDLKIIGGMAFARWGSFRSFLITHRKDGRTDMIVWRFPLLLSWMWLWNYVINAQAAVLTDVHGGTLTFFFFPFFFSPFSFFFFSFCFFSFYFYSFLFIFLFIFF